MTEEQHRRIIEASQPVIYITGSGGEPPPSPQENANRAWRQLGEELGFEFMTVRPVPGKSDYYFTAEPSAEGQCFSD